MRLFLQIFLLVFFVSFSAQAANPKNKLEELLIWKMSDELKLNSVQEQDFAGVIRTLNSSKATYTKDLQKSLEVMAKAKDSKLKEKELENYSHILRKLNQLTENEVKDMRRILGVEKLVEYLLLKQDIVTRIKSSLTNSPESSKVKELPAPKIIEQK